MNPELYHEGIFETTDDGRYILSYLILNLALGPQCVCYVCGGTYRIILANMLPEDGYNIRYSNNNICFYWYKICVHQK
jgi:hypothetical protein